MMESRQELLVNWIKQIFPKSEAQINFALVSGDASFRKYYRVSIEQQNFIAVDAPPSREDSKNFVRICNLLRHLGRRCGHACAIYANLPHGPAHMLRARAVL